MQNLLYVTPERPALTGSGSAMRIGMSLEALAESYSVHLLVIQLIGSRETNSLPTEFHKWCHRIEYLPIEEREREARIEAAERLENERRHVSDPAQEKPYLTMFATANNIAGVARVFEDVDFQAVHVFRLITAPFCEPYLSFLGPARPACVLDLDDVESKKFLRFALLHEANGAADAAFAARLDAERYARMEREYLSRFDRVCVCSREDQVQVAQEHGCRAVVLPNAVRLPAVHRNSEPDQTFTLLFLGNMEYFPNQDAALHFCSEILPRLRQNARRPFRVIIAGPRPSNRVKALAENPEVTVTGYVEDITASYGEADACIVPIRAGGGTRIKILEAFAYQRPVVATQIGAEGLEVTPGKELLLAGSPEEFAGGCLRLMRDEDLGRSLADTAFDWVRRHHTIDQVKACIRDLP